MPELIQRKSINDNLRKYDHLAKENSFIEITEWGNGEGWDITIDDRMMSLTWGQLDAIQYLTLALQYQK
jgi:ribosomal protein RSM22 (predicted rRNA methylase)